MPTMTDWNADMHPRGHPNNAGSFTTKQNTDPEASLNYGAGSLTPQGAGSLLEGTLTQTSERAARLIDDAVGVAAIQRAARRFAFRYQMSPDTRDDIAQDTIVDLLAQQRTNGLSALRDNPALLNAAARAVASRYLDPNVRHEDLTGRALLKKTRAEQEKELGRSMTSAEYKRLADHIRLTEFKPGRRPGAHYYLENRETSLSTPLGEEFTFGDTLVAEETDAPFANDTSPLADIVDSLERKNTHGDLVLGDGTALPKHTRSSVKAEAWNHFADVSDAPKVQRGTLDAVRAKAAAAAVVSHPGGVEQLARDWERGETTEAQDAALFAPFGDLSMSDRERAVGQLLRQPSYAEDLYGSALSIASSRAKTAA
ncbi:hypothetical protein B0H03_12039 [Rathayibacter iranicus NCPPB 2253 = VKM Ac-1602]|nr:hypothetical protein B0H03_12039 [Rathayibacter iranicus NCPPB 2253 = VKM Ac-1602]